MPLITFREVSLHFGEQQILNKTTFQVEPKERLCVLGRNGMGKSTLLKLMHSEIQADSGEIVRQTQLVTAKLEQDIPINITGSIYEVIASGLGEKGQLLGEYQHIIQQLASHSDEKILNRLQQLQQQLDTQHAWNLAPKIENVLSRLQLPAEQDFATLSGGLKRRVLLGKALVIEPDILMLDEPTNHLDIEAIEWIEKFLLTFNGTVIFITHDRLFLQKMATRILEIDRGNIKIYDCNYQQYLERKEHELEVEQQHNKLFDKYLAQEEVWIRQGIKARRTRNEGRVRRLEQLRTERQDRLNVQGKAKMQLQQAKVSGKIVIEAENITYHYQDKCLINNFLTTILRGDKIGIIGPNGVGKTTLLKILLGELTPQFGTIKHGTKLEIAYFDQLRAQLDDEKSVADNVGYGDQYVTINGKSIHIMSYLQDFLFLPQRARTAVKCLSGGERNRLLLARLFSKPANVLVLDEPTNDLDLETLELLEELLLDYSGTLLLVSHDRSFLNNIVTSCIAFEGEGVVSEYIGGYDDWLRQRPQEKQVTQPVIQKVPQPSNPDVQKQIKSVEQKIDKLEKQKSQLEQKLADPVLYETSQADKLNALQNQHLALETELASQLEEWEKLLSK